MYRHSCRSCSQSFESRRSQAQFCSRKCANIHNARERARARDAHPLVRVWSCGGGVDSTATAVLICNGTLPKPDLAVMVDCGWECGETMGYVRDVLMARLADVGVELQLVKTTNYRSNSLVENGHVVIPAYTAGPTRAIKYRTRCSGPWKVSVARRWLREQGVKRCENWVNMAADEQRRVRTSTVGWIAHRYPLVERGLSRSDCLWLIGRAGWPTPIRTSCVMCPLRTQPGWRRMARQQPADFARACQIEQDLQAEAPGVWLTPSLRPLAEVYGGRGD